MLTKGYFVHKKSMDMFIEILSIPYRGPNYIKIKYQCYNFGQSNNPYMIIPTVFRAKIRKEEYQNWKKINP